MPSLIVQSIESVRERIETAASRVGRSAEEIKLIAVTKNVGPARILEAKRQGLTDFGENRAQELIAKQKALDEEINWHFIGHLQTNKVKYIVSFIKLIQSLDSLKLAEEVNKQAKKVNKVQDVLVQVNASGEGTKFGLPVEQVLGSLESLSNFDNLRVCGLMTIAPLVEAELTRPVFRRLREVLEQAKNLKLSRFSMDYLSMGMTNDFEIAIEEGSNMVRIGTAIFGEFKE